MCFRPFGILYYILCAYFNIDTGSAGQTNFQKKDSYDLRVFLQ